MWADTVTWFLAQQPPLQGALISAMTSVGLFVLGLMTIWLNAVANRRNAVKAEADRQRLEIYREALKIIRSASKARGRANSYLWAMANSLELWRAYVTEGRPISPPKQRFLQFIELEGRFHSRLSDVMILLENWAIVDPRLKMFRLALAIQSDKLSTISQNLNGALMEALPMEGRDGVILDRPIPSTELVAKVRSLEKKYSYESGLLDAYYGDLNIELQELLLRHLFGHSVERRDPPDPAQFTLRLDKYDRIMASLSATEFLKRGDELDRELRKLHQTSSRPFWRRATRQS